MATDVTYSVGSGEGVYAGIASPAPAIETALYGDSEQTALLGCNLSPFFWHNGLSGGALKVIANSAVSGTTVAQQLARVDNLYTDGSPGLAGLPALGVIDWRGPANDARASAINSGTQANIVSLLAKLLTYAEIVFVRPVPALTSPETGGANVAGYNSYMQGRCALNPTRLIWIDDVAGISPVGSDGIHLSGETIHAAGVVSNTTTSSLFAGWDYPTPLSTDPADVYPAQPQWNPNHTMVGTSGTVGTGFTGQAVTGCGIGGYGSGYTGVLSVEAADVGDPNQTPIQWIEPTQVPYTGAGEAIVITIPLVGGTIPDSMDVVVETLFEAFNTNYFKWSRIQIRGGTSNQPVFPDLDLKMGGAVITHNGVVPRIDMDRILSGSESGLYIRWELATSAAHTGSMGRIGFRNLTARG